MFDMCHVEGGFVKVGKILKEFIVNAIEQCQGFF